MYSFQSDWLILKLFHIKENFVTLSPARVCSCLMRRRQRQKYLLMGNFHQANLLSLLFIDPDVERKKKKKEKRKQAKGEKTPTGSAKPLLPPQVPVGPCSERCRSGQGTVLLHPLLSLPPAPALAVLGVGWVLVLFRTLRCSGTGFVDSPHSEAPQTP